MASTVLSFVPTASSMLALGLPGGWEWAILLLLGLLIFGRRLPEVGRSLGKGIVEFKKGIKGIDEEIEAESSTSRQPAARLPESAPRQELPRRPAESDSYAAVESEKREA